MRNQCKEMSAYLSNLEITISPQLSTAQKLQVGWSECRLNNPRQKIAVLLSFVSSVRSSNSHPVGMASRPNSDPPPTFSVTHRSLILDFHFLSHYSYIKGNHCTHLLATCIPYGYKKASLQDSAR